MAWITPTLRTTGDLITAAIWNADVVNNPKYLKGQAGTTVLEDTQESDTDLTDGLGSLAAASKRWANIHGGHVWANGFKSPSRREVRITWDYRDLGTGSIQDAQLTITEAVGGTASMGGVGQVVGKVDDDGVNSVVRIDALVEQNSAAENAFTPSKRPYFRIEMHLDAKVAAVTHFFGMRATPGSAVPTTGESFIGFRKLLDNSWYATSSDGVTTNTDINTYVTTAARHTLEFFMHDSRVEFWVDGVLRATITANLPSATMELTPLVMRSDGGGGAGVDTHMTVGECIAQEDTP